MDNKLKKDILKKINKAYEQIDKSLDYASYEKIEYGVAKGLDELLEIERLIKEWEKWL